MNRKKKGTRNEMTEDQLLSAVIELAKFAGWRVAHFRPARTEKGWRTAVQGDPGFPDLVLAKQGRVIFAELKSEHGVVSSHQEAWINELAGSGKWRQWYVWRPKDWEKGLVAEALGVEGNIIPRDCRM